MIKDINIIEHSDMILNSSIIIFGAGGKGRRLLAFAKVIGCNVIGFCDNDLKKNGTRIDGIPVFCTDSLKKNINDNTIIIVASVWYRDIIDELLKFISSDIIFTEFSFILSVQLNRRNMDFKDPYTVNYFLENMLSRELKSYQYENEIMTLKAYLDINMNRVLVYQPGKVGSTALVDSINKTGCLKASHCHLLSSVEVFGGNKNHLEYCRYALKNFKGKIMVPLREPISRDISQYFQLLEARRGALLLGHNIDSLMEGFYEIFCMETWQKSKNYYIFQDYINMHSLNKGTIFDWFDVEMKAVFGIDVFDYPFDRERGYAFISYKGIDILIFQMEKMNDLKKEIGDFLGLKEFEIVRSNSGIQKEYQYLYRNFKDSLVLPKEYFEKYYKENKYYQHFYSDQAISEYRKKWIKITKDR